MNYKNIYDNFIKNKKLEKLSYDKEYEKHHIIPKSLNGRDHPINYIYLTKEDHYKAHLYLWLSDKNDSSLYWSLQWFKPFMSNYISQYYEKYRIYHWNKQNRSFLNSQIFKENQSDNMKVLWNNKDYSDKMISLRQTDYYKTNQSEKMKNAYKSGTKKKQKQNSLGRFESKEVIVENKIYKSISEASRKFNLSTKAVRNRCSSNNFPNWNYK